jgi:hypothetical protein
MEGARSPAATATSLWHIDRGATFGSTNDDDELPDRADDVCTPGCEYRRRAGKKTTTHMRGEKQQEPQLGWRESAMSPTKESAVGDRSPKKENAKKPTKSLKKKRSDKAGEAVGEAVWLR